jgi:hypothetical protein
MTDEELQKQFSFRLNAVKADGFTPDDVRLGFNKDGDFCLMVKLKK